MLLDSITDGGSWTQDLLADLPQSTIPQTASGIARADTYVQAYQPTVLYNADGTLASGVAVSPAVAKKSGWLDTVLGDISKVLGATGVNVNASGSGIVVQKAPSAGSTLYNNTGTPNLFQNPLFWLGVAVVGAAIIYKKA
jgi:hypothetical protein